MITRRRVLAFGLVLVLVAAFGVWLQYSAALRIERGRVSHGSQVISSPFGPMEFATLGEGAPILVSHGAGGGFDQVIEGASGVIGAGYRMIAPSRFGYLRSASPADPSPENQADAYVALLDALHIAKAAVVGISAGSPSALLFAARHPERCRALILMVPAVSVAGAETSPQGPLAARGMLSKALIEYTVRSDFLYWLGITVIPGQMIRAILATDPALVKAAGPAEQERIIGLLRHVLPLSERAQGLLNDARYTTEPLTVDLGQIKVPTLVVSLEDDFYNTIRPARMLATKIPGARLLSYTSGGHLWAGHEGEMLRSINAFLRQH